MNLIKVLSWGQHIYYLCQYETASQQGISIPQESVWYKNLARLQNPQTDEPQTDEPKKASCETAKPIN